MQTKRCPPEMQFLGEGDEDAQMTKFHDAPLRIDSPIDAEQACRARLSSDASSAPVAAAASSI